MNVCIWSTGSFEREYASYHLMKDIILFLLDRGYKVFLIQRQWGDGKLPEDLNGHSNLYVYNIRDRVVIPGFFTRYIRLCRYYLKSCKIIKNNSDINTVFIHSSSASWLPILITKRMRKKSVYNAQDIFPNNAVDVGIIKRNSLLDKLFRKLQKYGYKNADEIITVSEDMKQTLVDEYDVDEQNISVAYNWGHENQYEIDEDWFNERIPLKKKTRVVYAGNIGKMQNVSIIINSALDLKDNDDIEFLIIGNGSEKKAIQDDVKRYGLDSVFFSGLLPSRYAMTVYKNADINIIPLSNGVIKSALPSKTADCLFSEKPIIFCIDKDSFFAKTVQEYNIPIVDPSDAHELSKEIEIIKNAGWQGKPKEMWIDFFQRDNNLAIYEKAIRE